MPKGFRYITKERVEEKPYYSVLTNKGKSRRKNVIRSGTYSTYDEARREAKKMADKYNMNITIFDLHKARTNR